MLSVPPTLTRSAGSSPPSPRRHSVSASGSHEDPCAPGGCETDQDPTKTGDWVVSGPVVGALRLWDWEYSMRTPTEPQGDFSVGGGTEGPPRYVIY